MDSHQLTIFMEIDSLREELNTISQYLWNNPEVGREEVKAHNILTAFLEKQGFKVIRNAPTSTAFVASWGSVQDRSGASSDDRELHVAFMCENDALPGLGHACGHNLIAIAALGAGCGLKAALKKHKLPGRITVLGTPAEESYGGKVDHINAGFLKDVDFSIMVHPSHQNIVQPKYLACMCVLANFEGVPSHASEAPWLGSNALDAAVIAYQSLACLRQQMRPGLQLHSIFTKAGDAVNIIPHEAELYCMIRANTRSDLNDIYNKVTKCFEGAALASNCQLQLKMCSHPFDDIVHNKTLAHLYTKGLSTIPFEDNSENATVIQTREVGSGSSDMGNVSYVVPSLHPEYRIGCSDGAHTKGFCAATATKTAFEATVRQAKGVAMMSWEVLNTQSIIQDVFKDFENLK